MSSTKNIKVNIPSEIQGKIDNGDLILRGTQLRDRKGVIRGNLEALDAEGDHYFSPSIFVSFEGCAFVSVSTVSSRLQEDLQGLKERYASSEIRLESVLERQANDLISAISTFDEHFLSLTEGSLLTDEKETFSAGIKAASLLAANLPSHIDDYLGRTKVYHRHENRDGENYSVFLSTKKGRLYNWEITKSEFLNFRESKAHFLAYSFINLINNINILSLCYNSKAFPRCKENLNALKEQLSKLLLKLINGIGNEGDIYKMCYTVNRAGTYFPLDIEKIVKYDGTKINDLILREFSKGVDVEVDHHRRSSIEAIIEIMEEIENLLKRYDQISDLDLVGLSELSEIKKLVFNRD